MSPKKQSSPTKTTKPKREKRVQTEKPVIKPVSVAELDALINALSLANAAVEAKEEELKPLKKEALSIEGKIAAHLTELGREEYICPAGRFYIEEKWTVNMPQDDQAKAALWEHLRERGIFDKYATVNANSLNALYRADWDEAKSKGEGMTFAMPGVPPPQLFNKLKFKANPNKKG